MLIPFTSFCMWGVINDRASTGFDDYFTASNVYNYNFFFFGNGQSETISSYYWSPILSAVYEWPSDKIKTDHIPYTANSDLFSEILGYLNSGQFSTTYLDGFMRVNVLKHTEGYSTNDYKDFLMPILFPISDSKTYGSDEFINLSGDQNLKSSAVRTNSMSSFLVETNSEHLTSNPINSMLIAKEVNLEYSTLFDGLLNELEDIESSRGRGYHYEFEEHISDESTKSSLYDPSANYAETGIYEYDTVLDEPKTFEDTDFTVYDSELEFFLTEEDVNINDLAALETMFPGSAHLYDKKEFMSDKDWTVQIGAPNIDTKRAHYGAVQDKNTNTISYDDWFRSKNTNQPTPGTVKEPEKSIYYIGFKNSIYTKKLKRSIKNKLGLMRLHGDLRKARYYGKTLSNNLKNSVAFAYRRNMVYSYLRVGFLLKLTNTMNHAGRNTEKIIAKRVSKKRLAVPQIRQVLKSGISLAVRASRNNLLEIRLLSDAKISLLKPDRYISKTHSIFSLDSSLAKISQRSINKIRIYNPSNYSYLNNTIK